MFNGPKKFKYKKVSKSRLKNLDFQSNDLKFGTIGLKAVEAGLINTKSLEAARQAITRKIKRKGKVWIRIFPNVPITKKSTGARMGRGKGPVSHWVAKVRGGNVLFEICGVNHNLVEKALKTGASKLPIKTKIFN